MSAQPGGTSAERRERFVTAYVLSQNATAAAKAAGYSDDSAHAQGHRLLKRAEIRAEIERRLALASAPALAALADLGMSKAKLVEQLVPLVTTHMGHFLTVGEDGSVSVDIAKATAAQRAAIKRLVYHDNGKLKAFELYDRRQAGLDLAQILGYVVQKLNVRKVQSLDDLDDEELSRLAAGAPADLDTGGQRAN